MTDSPAARDPDIPRAAAPLDTCERLYQALFDSPGVGLCLLSAAGVPLKANHALCELLDYSEQELVARGLAGVTHPDDRHLAEEARRCLLAGECCAHRCEKRYVRRDGALVWAAESTTLLRDAEGHPWCLIAQVQNVTEHKHAEAELRRAQHLLASLIENAPTPTYATELDTRYRFVNPAWERFSGIGHRQAVGRAVGELFGAETAAQFAAACGEVLRTGQPAVAEETGDHLGRTYHFHTVRFPILDDAGEVEALGTISVDITERREAERQALERSRILASILAASTAGIALIRDRKRVWVNEAMATMCGQSSEEFLASDIRSHYADEAEYERVGRLLYHGGASASARQADTTWRRADGSTIQVRLQARPLDEEDLSQGYIVTATDITERLRYESELQASLQRYRGLYDSVPSGVLVWDARGTLIDANEAVCEILGLPREVILGQVSPAATWHAVYEDGSPFAEEDWPAHVTLRTGRRVRDVVIGLHSGDPRECRWLLVNSEPRLDPVTGALEAAVVTVVDVGDRKRAEATVQESERRFRQMANLLPDMVFELDPGLRVTYANRAAAELLGYDAADLKAGLYVAAIMDAPTLARATEGLQEAFVSGHSLIGIYDLKRRDGSVVPTEIHAMGVAGPDGELAGFRGVGRDIADRLRAEDSQRLAALGQLAAGVAHEFNNLLAGLMLQAELAAVEPSPRQYESLVATASAVASRGGDVCKSLTTFARPADPRREVLAVETMIEGALALASRQIQNSAVTVTRAYHSRGWCVQADSRQVEQVFLNVFVNACHAMPHGGTLTIQTRHAPRRGSAGDLVVAVTDTGTGISQEHLPHIFEPFFTTKGRLGDSDTPGAGLGLSVSHGIIKAHGGEIRARSSLGVGTTFELVLPACPAQTGASAEPARPPAEGAAPTRRCARVLVAEDNLTLAETVRAFLARGGHEVVCVATANEAVSALQCGPPDLVVTDLLMPGGGGRRVIEFARSLAPPLPVLVITGATQGQGKEALALGAGRVIQKPFTHTDLAEAVEQLLAGETAPGP